MSSPSSFSYRHSPKLFRKTVPEGSNDFQKVLDSIIHDEGRCHEHKHPEEGKTLNNFSSPGDDDFENLDDYSEDCEVGQILTANFSEPEVDNDNNNRVQDKYSKCVCQIRQCHRLDRDVASPVSYPDFVSPSEVKTFDSNGLLLEDENFHTVGNDSSCIVKLPLINAGSFIMGTTCSSSFYDRREWHNVAASEASEDRGRKHGKVPGRKSHFLFEGRKSSPRPGDKKLPQTCTCAQNNSENNIKSENSDDSGRSTPPSATSSDSKLDRSPSPLSDSRKVKSLPGKIPGHSKLSRISSSKKSATSAKLDVSPHRLLVRRSYSPQSRINSIDGVRRNRMNNDAQRQRSQSWSESKLGSKPSFKTSSPPTVHIQSPDPSPDANHTALNSSFNFTSSASKKSLAVLPSDQPDSPKSHEHGCPLFTEVEKDKLSVYVDYLEDDEITPISRRRAVSESHTSRALHRPSRRPDSADQGQCEDHPHVHWADEESGSALSTSVFLSSIRPRSYSHGAMGNRPHRPILKKVTGF